MTAGVYRWLLRASPKPFRAKFGDAMCAAFVADADAARRRGWLQLLSFCAVSFAQAVGFGALERLGVRPRHYGVTIADPVTHTSVALLLGLTAVVATWQPTRRAARIDPAMTLRDE